MVIGNINVKLKVLKVWVFYNVVEVMELVKKVDESIV